ncbi:MAG: hypothetical protein IMZ44_13310 [Planctomycetes bacterium]|nr:hypothetical protein [Planctomycetota bacterium]
MAKRRVRDRNQARFLAAYGCAGTISGAAEAAGLNRDAHYRWLDEDATYPQRFAEVDRKAVDGLLDEARRRAVDGEVDLVFHGDKQLTVPVLGPDGQALKNLDGSERRAPVVRRKKSDLLLMFLIKAKRPEYRDRARLDMKGVPGEGGDPDEGARKLDEPPPPDD